MNHTNPLEQYLAAIDRRDLGKLAEILDESVILVMLNGRVLHGSHAFLELHEAWFKDADWSWRTEVLHQLEYDQVAHYLLRVRYQDRDRSGATLLLTYCLGLSFRKYEGRWLLTLDQNTPQTEKS